MVLRCPHCLGRRSIVAFLDDPIVVHRILRHVGLDPEPRARHACFQNASWTLKLKKCCGQ